MSKKKIIVTGGAGFIGSHTVVEIYNAGYEPIIIDDFSNSEKNVLEGIEKIIEDKVKLYEGDCNDETFVEDVLRNEETIAGIIHFAAYKAVGESVEKPLDYYRNNINSTITLLQAMVKMGIANFVFSSSCTVYGEPEELPVTEKSPKKPAASPYGNTKQICEEIMEDTVNSGQPVKSIALRYFNPIGAHPSGLIGELPLGVPTNLVPFVTQTAAGVREQLTVFGDDYDTDDGTCIRDFIHVVDLARAHVKALEYLDKHTKEGLFDVFNAGTGKGNSVMEVIRTFEEVTGEKINYKIGPRRPGDVEQVYADPQKAHKHLEWKAELSLAQALRDAWNWQQKLAVTKK